ncbi:MAG: toxic anion resistance protein [Desulfamplus sp.]|nr:toxic anion resistance protein [Desulfamplus sp.]
MELIVADQQSVKQELGLTSPGNITVDLEKNPAIEKQASEFVASVLTVRPDAPDQLSLRESKIFAVEALGAETQKEASHRSAMLREPIRTLATRGEDGGVVATSLVELKNTVEELDPGKFDFEAGWFTRTLGMLPGIGTPLKKYFSRFESSQTVIEAIIRALDEGKKVLERDNITLSQDQKVMRTLTHKLESVIQLGMLIDQKLCYALERDIPTEDPKRRFVEDELLFPLRQRIQDLQQQLAVNQQGVMAIEIIIRNNKELIKGVERGKNVTINALNVAVTVALALANQKIVLDKIEAVNQVTDNLIRNTAKQLKTQGVAIQKQATQATLNMDSLKQAFVDINSAYDDISRFRQQALPVMANTILEMDALTRKAEESISNMEKGNRTAPEFTLDIV